MIMLRDGVQATKKQTIIFNINYDIMRFYYFLCFLILSTLSFAEENESEGRKSLVVYFSSKMILANDIVLCDFAAENSHFVSKIFRGGNKVGDKWKGTLGSPTTILAYKILDIETLNQEYGYFIVAGKPEKILTEGGEFILTLADFRTKLSQGQFNNH